MGMPAATKEQKMRKVFEIGGLVAAAVLIAFGIGAVVLGVNGHTTVRDSLQAEQIVGSDDMSPAAIAVAAKEAGLPASTPFPTVDVAGKPINTGDQARAFAGTCGFTRSRRAVA